MLTPRGAGGHKVVRRRGTVRRVVVAVIVLLAIGGAAGAAWWQASDSPDSTTAARPRCPEPSPAPTVVPATKVRVNVYNATDKKGLAGRVATQLRNRGFKVAKIDNDPARRVVTGVAEVRSSSLGAGPARTVGAQVDSFVAVPDQRRDASVDLVIGAAFIHLRSVSGAAAALQATPSPRPSGC